MRRSPLLLCLSWVSGCCGRDAPAWDDLETVVLVEGTGSLRLQDRISDDRGDLTFFAEGTDEVLAEVQGGLLELTAQPDWEGEATILLTAVDACGNESLAELTVASGSTVAAGACVVEIRYDAVGAPDAVALAGAFNDWSTESHRLEAQEDGSYLISLSLEPGAYPYKLVELEEGLFEDGEGWTCDPNAPMIQCDPGYKAPWETQWSHTCAPGVPSCNSLLLVESCEPPRLALDTLRIDRGAGQVELGLEAQAGAAEIAAVEATLDGAPLALSVVDGRVDTTLSGLSPGRHTVRLVLRDIEGRSSKEVYVPFWTDDFSWDRAVMYFAFVDRVADGDPTNNGTEGGTAPSGTYAGGDFAGLQGMLPYLQDLGVNVIWITNPQDNTEGAWDGDCAATYEGYHAYWPDDPYAFEEHMGGEEAFHALVEDAHARGMRVIMDWVANHVHETHPYYADHPEWFNPLQNCKDFVDGQMNFDRIPEECWFAPYLPDFDYTQPEPLVVMVDDAMAWVRATEVDGFRVDAVKHMPHAVAWNLASAIQDQVEHRDAGGDELFWTVGETFDGYDRIKAYIGPNQLTGQFDFPLYYAIRGAFLSGGTSLPDLMATVATSEATYLSAYGDALMSNFLGNHDVVRFSSEGMEGYQSACSGDGVTLRNAPVYTDPWIYRRLRLAWVFLLTQKPVPLLYYGDEIGVPGYADPDNRQPMWWHVADPHTLRSVDDLAARVGPDQAWVAQTVGALGRARADHPSMARGDTREWWSEPDLYAYARSDGSDHLLVVLNRGLAPRDLTNGLSFAGLPTSGTYVDLLSGRSFPAQGDSLALQVGAEDALVLVHSP